MFNWRSPSVNPLPHFTPPPAAWFPARFLSGLRSCLHSLHVCLWPFHVYALSILFFFFASPSCAPVLRAAFTNNRVPVLQRCGSLKETLSQGHGARSTVQGGPKDGARKVKECEGGQCLPSILAQTKAYHGEKVISSFEASRKRLLGPQEQEETAREDRERLAHPEKRARISAGETSFNSHKSLFAVVALNPNFCFSSPTRSKLDRLAAFTARHTVAVEL